MPAYEILKLLWPLLYRAVQAALDRGSCPRQAIQEAMDDVEAEALLEEWRKFKGK